VAQRLTDDGHPAIVENRVGANGIVATDAIAKVRPDGYTLIIGNHSTLAILPHMTKVGYDPTGDFVPIALMVAAPNVLVVKASLPVFFPPKGKPFGFADPASWQRYGQWMFGNHLLKRPPNAGDALTNEFLPGQGL